MVVDSVEVLRSPPGTSTLIYTSILFTLTTGVMAERHRLTRGSHRCPVAVNEVMRAGEQDRPGR